MTPFKPSVFQAGGPLSPQHPTYISRAADALALRLALQGEYLHVMAPRQEGKTSLLRRLAYQLAARGWRCAYIDCSTLMDLEKAEWYGTLGSLLASGLTPGETPNLRNQVDLRLFLTDCVRGPDASGASVFLIFDEIEAASKVRDEGNAQCSDAFFMTLRNLYIQRDDYPGRLAVALAGAVCPEDLVTDPSISPFNVGYEIPLRDLEREEASAVTARLDESERSVAAEVHQAIFDWTLGHPYLTQRLCLALEEITGRVTTEDVDRAVAGLLHADPPVQRDKNLRHVARCLAALSPQAALTWRRLCREERPRAADVSDPVLRELYLTGAVTVRSGELVIRNPIYVAAFAQTAPVSTEAGEVEPEGYTPLALSGARQVRIFISSTWEDLKPEREAVERALALLPETSFCGMEYFGSRMETTRDVSLQEVDRSEVYIGIFASRYGSGITEAEYRRALDRGLVCFIYFKDEGVGVLPAHVERVPEKAALLERLKAELQATHTVVRFRSPAELATRVLADLHRYLSA